MLLKKSSFYIANFLWACLNRQALSAYSGRGGRDVRRYHRRDRLNGHVWIGHRAVRVKRISQKWEQEAPAIQPTSERPEVPRQKTPKHYTAELQSNAKPAPLNGQVSLSSP